MAREDYWNRYWDRRFSRRRLLGGALAAGAGLSALGLVGCGGDSSSSGSTPGATTGGATSAPSKGASPSAQAKKRGGTLKVGNPTMLGQFEPNISTNGADWALLFAIYDTLFVTDNSGALQPKLATKSETNGGQITLTLRQGVKFQDGTPFNASAVKRNVERTLQMGAKSRIFSQWSQVDSVQTPDESTVIFKLKQPQYGPILANMATISGAMPSPDAIDKLGQDFSSKPVGSGPYQVDSVALDSRVTAKAFKDYWGAPDNGPFMDGIEFHIVAQAPSLVTAMQAGEIDLIHYPVSAPASEIQQLKAVSGVHILQQPAHSFTEVRLNRGKPPFDNTDLLKAFGYALDRKAILSAINGNMGKIAGGPINPATWAWDPNFVGFAVDDATREQKVKQHLQAGGSPNGFSFTLTGSDDRTQAIAQQVKKYGINATIQQTPPSTSYLYDGDFQGVPSYTPQYSPDPDSIFRPNFYSTGQFNYHRFKSTDLDALIDKAAAETDQAKRTQIYHDAQNLVFDLGIPRIPNVFPDILVPLKDRVQALTVGWETYVRLGGVWLNG